MSGIDAMQSIDIVNHGVVMHIPLMGAIASLALSLGIMLATFVAPLWIIFHYGSRWRASQGLAAQDEKLLVDLWDIARRLEERIGNLERAVGAEAPAGKSKEVR